MVQKIAQSNIFVGFSSAKGIVGKTKLYDLELIKQDLINHLYTARGERLMMPEYGSIIWELLYEPMTEGVVAAIVDDVARIVNSDSRLEFNDLDIKEFDYGIQIDITMLYRPFDIVDQMSITFDRRSKENRGSV